MSNSRSSVMSVTTTEWADTTPQATTHAVTVTDIPRPPPRQVEAPTAVPAPPTKWSRSVFGASLTAFFFFILLGAALLVCALPPLFVQGDWQRKIYVATMVPTTAVLGTVMCCYTFIVPYVRSNRFLVKSAEEFTRHREFLLSARAHKQSHMFTAPDSPFGAGTVEEADAQSQYYHRSPAAQQHSDSLEVKREMDWIRRQLEHLLADPTLRSGNPTMSVQQRSLQLFLFSFLDVQQALMTLLQDTISDLKEANYASSVRAQTIRTSRSAPRTPADGPLVPAAGRGDPLIDSPSLQPVFMHDDGRLGHSSPSSHSPADSQRRDTPDVSGISIAVDDVLPPTDTDGQLETPQMPRFTPLLSETSSQIAAKYQRTHRTGMQGKAAAVPTAVGPHTPTSTRPLQLISQSAVARPGGPPSATSDRTVTTLAPRAGQPTGTQESVSPSASPPPAPVPRPVPQVSPSLPSLTLQRGARFPSDNAYVFLHIRTRTRSTFTARESNIAFEASVTPAGAPVGEATAFGPNEQDKLPFTIYSVIGGERRALSIMEMRSLGFVSCDIEKVSLGETASPSSASDSLGSVETSAQESQSASQGSSALLASSSRRSARRRLSMCSCPDFVHEASFIVSWAPLPDVPMRLAFLVVDFVDTSISPAPAPRAVALPVLECLIQDTLCVVTTITAEMHGSRVGSVTLEGLCLEDPASRAGSSASSSAGVSPTKTYAREDSPHSRTARYASRDFGAMPSAGPGVGDVMTETIAIAQPD